ncbi:uncharacterized, partial [Tachysurus ichikawai]
GGQRRRRIICDLELSARFRFTVLRLHPEDHQQRQLRDRTPHRTAHSRKCAWNFDDETTTAGLPVFKIK